MSVMAGASVSDLASAIAIRNEEASIVAELKAGSEDAYAWLITQYHQPIYSLVYRILDDPVGCGRHHPGSLHQGLSRASGASMPIPA